MDPRNERPHMPLEERAKIFSPFDPLQGFRDALREKEREVEESMREPWETAGTDGDAAGDNVAGSDVAQFTQQVVS